MLFKQRYSKIKETRLNTNIQKCFLNFTSHLSLEVLTIESIRNYFLQFPKTKTKKN